MNNRRTKSLRSPTLALAALALLVGCLSLACSTAVELTSLEINDNHGAPTDLAVLDLDRDGQLDLVAPQARGPDRYFIAAQGTHWMSPTLLLSSYHFERPVGLASLTEYDNHTGVSVGDLDLDGRSDLVFTNASNHDPALFLNRFGDDCAPNCFERINPLALQNNSILSDGNEPFLIDIDADRDLDIVVGANQNSLNRVVINNCCHGGVCRFNAGRCFRSTLRWENNRSVSSLNAPGEIVAWKAAVRPKALVGAPDFADVHLDANGDGAPDAVFADENEGIVHVIGSRFARRGSWPRNELGGLDETGQELVDWTLHTPNLFNRYFVRGRVSASAMAIVDEDGDGDLDILVFQAPASTEDRLAYAKCATETKESRTTFCSSNLTKYPTLSFRRNGATYASAALPKDSALGQAFLVVTDAVVADMDNNGQQDLVLSALGANEGTKIFKRIDKRWASAVCETPMQIGSFVGRAIRVAHADDDGFADVIGTSTHNTVILHGDGACLSHQSRRVPLMSAMVTQAASGDFDGDGDKDIYLAVNSDSNADDRRDQILLQTEPMQFEAVARPLFPAGATTETVAAIDLHRSPQGSSDGRDEILVFAYQSVTGFDRYQALGFDELTSGFVNRSHLLPPGFRGNPQFGLEFPRQVKTADFDGDGDLDVFLSGTGHHDILVNSIGVSNNGTAVWNVRSPEPRLFSLRHEILNQGNAPGNFLLDDVGRPIADAELVNYSMAAVGNFDASFATGSSDNRPDIVLAFTGATNEPNPGDTRVFIQAPNGSFHQSLTFPRVSRFAGEQEQAYRVRNGAYETVGCLEASDLDGDGIDDIVMGTVAGQGARAGLQKGKVLIYLTRHIEGPARAGRLTSPDFADSVVHEHAGAEGDHQADDVRYERATQNRACYVGDLFARGRKDLLAVGYHEGVIASSYPDPCPNHGLDCQYPKEHEDYHSRATRILLNIDLAGSFRRPGVFSGGIQSALSHIQNPELSDVLNSPFKPYSVLVTNLDADPQLEVILTTATQVHLVDLGPSAP